MIRKPHIFGSKKITEACNPKMVFKICEGISCSSFFVKELDVIAHKNYFPCITILNFGILYPTSLANLVVEVGTRHSHQILLVSRVTFTQEVELTAVPGIMGYQERPCTSRDKLMKWPTSSSTFPVWRVTRIWNPRKVRPVGENRRTVRKINTTHQVPQKYLI